MKPVAQQNTAHVLRVYELSYATVVKRAESIVTSSGKKRGPATGQVKQGPRLGGSAPNHRERLIPQPTVHGAVPSPNANSELPPRLPEAPDVLAVLPTCPGEAADHWRFRGDALAAGHLRVALAQARHQLLGTLGLAKVRGPRLLDALAGPPEPDNESVDFGAVRGAERAWLPNAAVRGRWRRDERARHLFDHSHVVCPGRGNLDQSHRA